MKTKTEYGDYPIFLGGQPIEEERQKALRGLYLKVDRILSKDTHKPLLLNLLKEL